MDRNVTLPALIVAALVATPLIGLLADWGVGDAAARQRTDADGRAIHDVLEARGWSPSNDRVAAPLARRGLELRVATREFDAPLAHGVLRGDAPDADASSRAAAVVARELARYPDAWLARAGLRRVLLVASLTENGSAIPSLPNHLATLVLDVGASPEYIARLVHHEVFHFFDRASRERLSPDPEWDRQNPPGFSYGSGGRAMRESWAGEARGDLPGFVTAYATSGVEEDKAELFAFAMTRSADVTRQAAGDPALARKLTLLLHRVSSFGPPPEGLAVAAAPR